MQPDSKPIGAPPKASKKGSCLVVGLIIVAAVILFGGGLIGLAILIDRADGMSFGDGLAVIEIQGVITADSEVVKNLVRFRRDDKVKAIIIRIDSPGGGVAPSQEIYREVRRTRKDKKVVVSMGGVAASGGLYIASAADKVLANPGTVTGSIGVIMQMMNVEELLGKVGVSSVVVKSGRYKDIGSMTRTMTEEERAVLQGMVDKLHKQFVRDLAKGRGLKEEQVAAIADGRIFSGEEAVDLGLVDGLGNFEDAVDAAARFGGLKRPVRLIYPRKKTSFFEQILEGKSPVQILPGWITRPVAFQYLYLPGL
ncbi:MAG: signal peptide peptidase SppA [Proteobacteria bacterium]|nr:signal peptide peptidase SppA [Pseudomonadota bacterium]